jgi:hypothetical protein
MFLRLQRYDIELSYKQGKHVYIADTLSRAYLKTNKDEVEQINMADYLVISEERQKLIAEATKQDKTLEQLLKVIEQGWDTSYIPNDLNPYYNVRNDLSIQNGIIFKGDRCVIPSMTRNEIMSQMHTHIGIEGCLKRAR